MATLRDLTAVTTARTLLFIIAAMVPFFVALAMAFPLLGAPPSYALIPLLLGPPVLALGAWATVVQPGRIYVEDLARMRAGEAWAHWRYDEAGWAGVVAREAALERRQRRQFLGVAGGTGAVLLAMALLVPTASRPLSLALVAGVLALLGTVGLGLGLFGAAPRAGRQRAGAVYITPLGVAFEPGGYVPLVGPGQALREVSLEQPPAGLAWLRFRALVSRRGGATVEEVAAVAVPPGEEVAARELIARFRREVLPPGV